MPFCPTLSLQKVSGSDMIELESWFLLKASSKLVFTVTTHSMSSCVFWSSCRHHVCTQVLFYCSIPTFYSWGWWQKPALATIQSKSLYVKCAYGSLTNDLKSLDSVVCVYFEKTCSNVVLVRKSFHQFRAKVARREYQYGSSLLQRGTCQSCIPTCTSDSDHWFSNATCSNLRFEAPLALNDDLIFRPGRRQPSGIKSRDCVG